jgi:hypothetical protein
MANENYELSSITIQELRTLERAIFEDILRRKLRTNYSIRDQQFSFATIEQASRFLEWIRGEIAIRQPGDGFSVATFIRP